MIQRIVDSVRSFFCGCVQSQSQVSDHLLGGFIQLAGTCGGMPSDACSGYYDYVDLLDALQTHYPKTTFFQAWHLCWSLGFNGHAGGGFGKAQALMSHPLLMDLDELDFVLDP